MVGVPGCFSCPRTSPELIYQVKNLYSAQHRLRHTGLHHSSSRLFRIHSNMADQQEGSKIILVSDLNWTMVNHHDPDHRDLRAFNEVWESQFTTTGSTLIFSSGRSPVLYQELAQEVPLLQPDVLVCSVGTEILLDHMSRTDEAWESYLDGQGWDRNTVLSVVKGCHVDGVQFTLQQETEQRPHKVSYKVHGDSAEQIHKAIEGLRGALDAKRISANVIYSGGVDLDVLPQRASKGKALAFLLEQLGVHTRDEKGEVRMSGKVDAVVVCGDSGNDIELFEVPHVHGCIVANAHDELRQWYEQHGKGNTNMFFASKDGPSGIVECLSHYTFMK